MRQKHNHVYKRCVFFSRKVNIFKKTLKRRITIASFTRQFWHRCPLLSHLPTTPGAEPVHQYHQQVPEQSTEVRSALTGILNWSNSEVLPAQEKQTWKFAIYTLLSGKKGETEHQVRRGRALLLGGSHSLPCLTELVWGSVRKQSKLTMPR